jgi:hypothetical protein
MSWTAGLPAIILVALVSLTACVSAETGKPFESKARQGIRLKTTTPTELVKLLGPPLRKTAPVSGSETWTYEYTSVSALQLPYLPMMWVRQTPHEMITVRVVDGVVVDCTYFRETYVTRGKALVPASTVQEPC